MLLKRSRLLVPTLFVCLLAGAPVLSHAGGDVTPPVRVEEPDQFCDGVPIADYRAGRVPWRRVVPRDDGRRDPEFAAFREELKRAVARRDVEAIVRVTSADAVFGFDGERGPEYLRRLIANPDANFWEEFGLVLGMAATLENGEFIAPYVSAQVSGLCWAIVGERVRVREAPSVGARTLATLDYHIVEQWNDGKGGPPLAPGWLQVRLPTGVIGFVSSRFVRSPIDYRAHFAREHGAWRLTAFVGGD